MKRDTKAEKTSRGRRANDIFVRVFVSLNAVLYLAYMSMDIGGYQCFLTQAMFMHITLSAALKYAGMIFCLALALLSLRKASAGRDARLQVFATGFALIADFFLLFTDMFLAGIVIFFAAHLSAIARYRPERFRLFLFLTMALSIVSAASVYLMGLYDARIGAQYTLILPFSCVYALLIVSLSVYAFSAKQARKNRALSSAGMMLFLLCDVNVAFYNAAGPASMALAGIASTLMWAFYLPAQTLLALSAREFLMKHSE